MRAETKLPSMADIHPGRSIVISPQYRGGGTVPYEDIVENIHEALRYGNIATAKHWHARLCKLEKAAAHAKAIRAAGRRNTL